MAAEQSGDPGKLHLVPMGMRRRRPPYGPTAHRCSATPSGCDGVLDLGVPNRALWTWAGYPRRARAR